MRMIRGGITRLWSHGLDTGLEVAVLRTLYKANDRVREKDSLPRPLGTA